MQSFFSPSAVAIVGASSKPGKIGYEIVKNVKTSHTGAIFPVNPTQSNILGCKCYPRVSAIPEPVDLAMWLSHQMPLFLLLRNAVGMG